MSNAITDPDLQAVLGGMVIALAGTMPPALARQYAQRLRACARERADAGRTSAETLLQSLAEAAEAAAAIPRTPG